MPACRRRRSLTGEPHEAVAAALGARPRGRRSRRRDRPTRSGCGRATPALRRQSAYRVDVSAPMRCGPVRGARRRPDATLDEVHAARRRLAKRAPSRSRRRRGGDAGDQRRLRRRVALTALSRPAPTPHRSTSTPAADDAAVRRGTTGPSAPGRAADTPSFTIDALPVEAFEALLVVAVWIGEVLDDDPPYVLESHLVEPFACWCRLDLVPDAGASTVSLDGRDVGDDLLPDVDAVRRRVGGEPQPARLGPAP